MKPLLPHSFSFLILAVLFVLALADVQSVFILQRHGNRAPNDDIAKICPNYANIPLYKAQHVDYAMLTGYGMRQLELLGTFIKRSYLDSGYLADYHDYYPTKVTAFASNSPRCIQSCLSTGYTMYPDGTGVPRASGHSFFSVESNSQEHDNVLACRKAKCDAEYVAHTDQWLRENIDGILKDHASMISQVSKACGFDFTTLPKSGTNNIMDSLKVVNDATAFDINAGFPLISGIEAVHTELNAVCQSYIDGSLLINNDAIVASNGKLPKFMLETWGAHLDAANHDGPDPSGLVLLCGHREILYALRTFFGFSWNLPGDAMVAGQLPPGSAIVFEQHCIESSTGPADHLIMPYLWYPDGQGASFKRLDLQFTSPDGKSCGKACPLDFIQAIHDARNANGTYKQICEKFGEEIDADLFDSYRGSRAWKEWGM
ncbi:Histidine phosphatase superfamily [Carpediemonas membranifera]|uniref:Histidine phosphatase superfamily n=1 Tax=Carpediemonas membranifera TaxID=201153 RepID=A0A8J6B1N5_9EUKA|nr:Histidine phosphatase superfamily [Carpediemonas membranifera]|eukprot:KAG9396540.1 Histidine phosphatase superfamily [Carpediemonas membranifera]